MMKKPAVTVLALLILSSSLIYGSAPPADQEFTAFWTRFKSAIARNDRRAVAGMTKLPFLFDSKERSHDEYLRIYPKLFTPKIRRCVVRAKPMKEGDNYAVFCGELIFYFGKDGGQYKFLEFGVND